jgi:maltooligosyltrehalose trehalohydrolase
MTRGADGYWSCDVGGVAAGTVYDYQLDGGTICPDPASRHQPRGVHGPSAVVDTSFVWSDGDYRPPALSDYVIYELHVGTFSEAGTFDGVIEHLDELATLGVTAVELMPVAQFPGERNWGYDGVFPFAVQHSYGGPSGLQRLVDSCHGRGLAVILDVVYNHLGPEGNYLGEYGPYFTDTYRTPWGDAINFDGVGSDDVRQYFIQNALYWLRTLHIDALRLDAVHAIIDRSADPFLAELRRRCDGHGYLIPESDGNDRRLVTTTDRGGFCLDAQWNDDFHHALHTILTRETDGYYADFGSLDQLAKAYREGFVYSGQYSRYRRRRHGSSSRDIEADRLVVFAQNHDQVGNRAQGDRLASLVPHEALKLAAGAVLLSPYIPLIFMGEEYGETAPFLYFTSHTDPELGEAVRRGRRAEFAAFGWTGEVPDPQSPSTFHRSRLTREANETILDYYRHLIELRRGIPVLGRPSKSGIEVSCTGNTLTVHRGDAVVVTMNFGEEPAEVTLPQGEWFVRSDSSSRRWGGPGSTHEEELQCDGRSTTSISPLALLLLERR